MQRSKASILEDYDAKRDFRKEVVHDLFVYKKGVEECERYFEKAKRELDEARERLRREEEYEARNREEINELWKLLVEEST
jgi:sugar-specific transcriptional regulator TrmB